MWGRSCYIRPPSGDSLSGCPPRLFDNQLQFFPLCFRAAGGPDSPAVRQDTLHCAAIEVFQFVAPLGPQEEEVLLDFPDYVGCIHASA